MNGLPYYKAYPRDFFEGTAGMPVELKGIYRLILDLIYMQGGALVDDPRYIAGHLGCGVKTWTTARAKLIAAGKIYAIDERLRNNRADKEQIITASFLDKQRINGSTPKKNNGLPEAVAKPKASHTEPEPDTESKKDRDAKASLVRFAEFWAAYPHRDGKRGRKTAEAKYRAAVKRGIAEQTIIDGAKRAHADPRVKAGYARDPTTWLNQAGWDDEFAATVTPIRGGYTPEQQKARDAAFAAMVAKARQK
jgi:uncharacterized protein YdaU (DUF1376 family)